MNLSAISEKFDEYYHNVWQSGFIYRYPDIVKEIISADELQHLQDQFKLYDDYKAGKSDIKPPLPKMLINIHRDRKRENEAWIAELGHEPTAYDRLRRFKPLFDADQPGDDSIDEPVLEEEKTIK